MASSYLPFPAALRPLPPFSSSNLLKQITNIHNWQQEYNCRKWLFDIFSGWRVGWRLHSTGQKITQIQLRNERKSGHTRHIRHSIKLNGGPERWCDIFFPPPQVAPPSGAIVGPPPQKLPIETNNYSARKENWNLPREKMKHKNPTTDRKKNHN